MQKATINPLATAREKLYATSSVSVSSNLFELAVEAVRNGGAVMVFADASSSYSKSASKVLSEILNGSTKNLDITANVSPAMITRMASAAYALGADPTLERSSSIVFYSSEDRLGITVLSTKES